MRPGRAAGLMLPLARAEELVGWICRRCWWRTMEPGVDHEDYLAALREFASFHPELARMLDE